LCFFVVICLSAIILLTARSKLVGGELYSADFKNGFNLYIEESYFQQNDSAGGYSETPHSVWLVSDALLKANILKLCKEISIYRQLERSSDIMLGDALNIEHYSRLYLDTGSYCYRIDILNWKNYSGGAWVQYPIRIERFNEPTLHILRLDLSLSESEDSYSFAKGYFGPDSVNSDGGFGWYSTISQKHLDELLLLTTDVCAINAEIVWTTDKD
jgi:hypothetical protein